MDLHDLVDIQNGERGIKLREVMDGGILSKGRLGTYLIISRLVSLSMKVYDRVRESI